MKRDVWRQHPSPLRAVPLDSGREGRDAEGGGVQMVRAGGRDLQIRRRLLTVPTVIGIEETETSAEEDVEVISDKEAGSDFLGLL